MKANPYAVDGMKERWCSHTHASRYEAISYPNSLWLGDFRVLFRHGKKISERYIVHVRKRMSMFMSHEVRLEGHEAGSRLGGGCLRVPNNADLGSLENSLFY